MKIIQEMSEEIGVPKDKYDAIVLQLEDLYEEEKKDLEEIQRLSGVVLEKNEELEKVRKDGEDMRQQLQNLTQDHA